MNGHNHFFLKDPFDYAQNVTINVINLKPSHFLEKFKYGSVSKSLGVFFVGPKFEQWEENNIVRGNAAYLPRLDAAKEGLFDFEPEGKVGGKSVIRVCFPQDGLMPTGPQAEKPIGAYWIPYVASGTQGTSLGGVPYADLPLDRPKHRFAFTGSMNGCSLVVRKHPSNSRMIRAHHDSCHDTCTFEGKKVLLRLDYDDVHGSPNIYGATNNELATSFNFFYWKNGKWYLVCQPQVITDAGEQGPDGRPGVQLNAARAPFEVEVPEPPSILEDPVLTRQLERDQARAQTDRALGRSGVREAPF